MRRRELALLLLAEVCGIAGAQTIPKAKVEYQISGVAVSSRDGAPIPFCMLHLTPAEAAVQAGSGAPMVREDRSHGSDRRDVSRFRSRSGTTPEPGITADAQGRFSVPAPGPGAWLLTGVAHGFPAQGFEAHESFAAAIVLTPEKPTAHVSFALAANAMIAGLVLDDAGDPVADATVQAQSLDEVAGSNVSGRPQAAAFGQTDDRGRYELSGLAPGRYRVRVEARPWYAAGGGDRFSPVVSGAAAESPLDPSLDVVYGVTWYPGADEEDAGEVLTLASGELRQADFHLAAIAAAHIVVPRVAGSGTEMRDTRNWTGPLVTRDGGANNAYSGLTGTMRMTPDSWLVGGLAPGTYQLRLPGEDGHPSTEVEQFTVHTGAAGAVDLAGAQPLLRVGLTFTGADAERLEVTLTNAASGRRYSSSARDRSPFGGQREHGKEEDRERSMLVPEGDYMVSITGSDNAYLMGVSATGANVAGTKVTILRAGASLQLRLADGRAAVNGIALEQGRPVTGAMVLLVPATTDMQGIGEATARDESNTDGSFELNGIVPGQYILVVVNHGWQTNWRDPATLAALLLRGTPLEVKRGATLKVNVGAIEP